MRDRNYVFTTGVVCLFATWLHVQWESCMSYKIIITKIAFPYILSNIWINPSIDSMVSFHSRERSEHTFRCLHLRMNLLVSFHAACRGGRRFGSGRASVWQKQTAPEGHVSNSQEEQWEKGRCANWVGLLHKAQGCWQSSSLSQRAEGKQR